MHLLTILTMHLHGLRSPMALAMKILPMNASTKCLKTNAIRDCIKSIALKNKVQTETERMHTISRRLGSRQILWLLYDFLRPHVTGDSAFKLVDLVKTTIDRFTHGTEQERLEASGA